MLCGLTCHT